MILETTEHVTVSRTNADAKLSLLSVLDIMQDIDQRGVESYKEFWDYFAKHGLALFLVSRQLQIVRPPDYGETLTARTLSYDNNVHLGYRYSEITDAQNEVCARSWSIGAFVDTATGRAGRVPREFSSLAKEVAPMPPPSARRINLPDVPSSVIASFMVKPGDVDMNRHMNNVRYIKYALDALDLDAEPVNLRVEYKLPAVAGDVLSIERYNAPDGTVFAKLLNADSRVCAVFEFSC
jgi:acyl-ACP thioesterase